MDVKERIAAVIPKPQQNANQHQAVRHLPGRVFSLADAHHMYRKVLCA